jgi:hypothetical protein
MRALASDRVDGWVRGTGIVALVVLAWAVFLPDGSFFWTAVLAAGLMGASVAAAVLVHSRGVPTLDQVIASAEAEPLAAPAGRGFTTGAGKRPSPRGEGKP